MPPKQPKHNQPLTTGDRLVSALLGGLCGFGTMVVIWFIVLYAGGRLGTGMAIPFYLTYIVGGIVAVVGLMVGPERMLDGFEEVWGIIGIVLFWRTPREQSEMRSRRGRR